MALNVEVCSRKECPHKNYEGKFELSNLGFIKIHAVYDIIKIDNKYYRIEEDKSLKELPKHEKQ